MKKLLFLLAILMFYALPTVGQKNDSAVIRALNNTFDFQPDSLKADEIDSTIKAEDESRYYWPDRVFVSFAQEHFQGLKETAPLAKILAGLSDRNLLPEPNNFLTPLGIDYSLKFFKRCRWDSVDTNQILYIMVSTKPGQKVVDAIKDLKKRFPIKIEFIGPEYFPDAQPGAW